MVSNCSPDGASGISASRLGSGPEAEVGSTGVGVGREALVIVNEEVGVTVRGETGGTVTVVVKLIGIKGKGGEVTLSEKACSLAKDVWLP